LTVQIIVDQKKEMMMKLTYAVARTALVVIAVSVMSLSAAAQESKVAEKDVPAAVIAAFKSAYPQATVRGYAREKENGKVFYEIESKDGSTMRDLLYNPDGSVAEIEETIAVSDLPAAAQEVIHSQYPKAVVTKAEKVTQGSKIGYEVSAKQGTKRISLEFDANGKVLKNKVR
jgi:uncharacterized membrane protein YkoI